MFIYSNAYQYSNNMMVCQIISQLYIYIYNSIIRTLELDFKKVGLKKTNFVIVSTASCSFKSLIS